MSLQILMTYQQKSGLETNSNRQGWDVLKCKSPMGVLMIKSQQQEKLINHLIRSKPESIAEVL
jgi:hypothetical protein